MRVPEDKILNAVTSFYKVDIYADTHKREISFPRQVAMTLLWRFGRLSVNRIGEMFSRDHTSVSHAKKTLMPYAKTIQK